MAASRRSAPVTFLSRLVVVIPTGLVAWDVLRHAGTLGAFISFGSIFGIDAEGCDDQGKGVNTGTSSHLSPDARQTNK
jgi:hypothetical protein